MLVKDEGICDRNIQQKEEDILVKLPGLVTTRVVAPKLIAPIYSTHKVIVEKDTLGTGDRDSCAIVNAPLNCTSVGWLSVRGHHCRYFFVQPGSSCYLPILHGDGVASVTKGENILLLMCIIIRIQLHTRHTIIL